MKIMVFSSDDWVLVKVDSAIIHSGHSVSPIDLVNLLKRLNGVTFDDVFFQEVSQEAMEILGA